MALVPGSWQKWKPESNTDKPLQIKKAFDPLCLLNCDKVVRMEKPAKGEVAEW